MSETLESWVCVSHCFIHGFVQIVFESPMKIFCYAVSIWSFELMQTYTWTHFNVFLFIKGLKVQKIFCVSLSKFWTLYIWRWTWIQENKIIVFTGRLSFAKWPNHWNIFVTHFSFVCYWTSKYRRTPKSWKKQSFVFHWFLQIVLNRKWKYFIML